MSQLADGLRHCSILDTLGSKVQYSGHTAAVTNRDYRSQTHCSSSICGEDTITPKRQVDAVPAPPVREPAVDVKLAGPRASAWGINDGHICLHSRFLLTERSCETIWRKDRVAYLIPDQHATIVTSINRHSAHHQAAAQSR